MGSLSNSVPPLTNVYRSLAPNHPTSDVNHTIRSPKTGDASALPPFPPDSSSRYMECLRNHGANIGAHILDGCGEFMPDGEDGTPESLKCAACECHRNFHRKLPPTGIETGGVSWDFTSPMYPNFTSCNLGKSPRVALHSRPMMLPSLVHRDHHPKGLPASPIMVAFGGSRVIPHAMGSTSSEDDRSTDDHYDHTTVPSNGTGHVLEGKQYSGMKIKRFRTKFTREQKEKMVGFAEKLGWKIGKQDEHELTQFCAEAGVKRKVFKVWMHNNKRAILKKKFTSSNSANGLI